LIGLAIAALGTFAAEYLSMPALDGIASIGIALVLGVTAFALARESKGLLIGEAASPKLRDAIESIARSIDGIDSAQIVFTVHMAPDQVIAALSLEFRDSLETPEIERAIDALERAIHERHPEMIAIFVKPQAAATQATLPGRFPGKASRPSGSTSETASAAAPGAR
jgi:divalent metal cation (Fe/Co/Zn/Cd) transporter